MPANGKERKFKIGNRKRKNNKETATVAAETQRNELQKR
jgi:hypothetical protein